MLSPWAIILPIWTISRIYPSSRPFSIDHRYLSFWYPSSMDITPRRSNTGSFQLWKSSGTNKLLGAPQIPLEINLYSSKVNTLHPTTPLPSWRIKSQVSSIALGIKVSWGHTITDLMASSHTPGTSASLTRRSLRNTRRVPWNAFLTPWPGWLWSTFSSRYTSRMIWRLCWMLDLRHTDSSSLLRWDCQPPNDIHITQPIMALFLDISSASIQAQRHCQIQSPFGSG